jgi:hypothetical protein
LVVEGGFVTMTAHLAEVVISLRVSTAQPSSGTIEMTLGDLDRHEHAGSDVVSLDPAQRDQAHAESSADKPDVGSKQVEEDPIGPEWPVVPEHLISVSPTFPRTLHEAGRCAAHEPSRYAMQRIQIRGKTGQVLGTDGKQALVQGGFTFPFAEDLLLPAVPVFGSKELASERGVSIGLNYDWLCLILGPWRFWLAADREGRFPDVLAAIPRANGARLLVDDQDAETLIRALPTLPGAREEHRPVTLDLGPTATVRSRNSETGEIVEVPLPRSQPGGSATRLVLDGEHFQRALTLGCREFRSASPERPVSARGEDRIYLCATLDPAGAIAPEKSDVSLSPSLVRPASRTRRAADALTPVIPSTHSTRRLSMPRREPVPIESNGHADPPPEALDPLVEAEALRAALAEAASRAIRLVASLKQFRKERQAITSAWSRLRQLNLGP